MAIWKVDITKQKGQFPFKAQLVSKNGRHVDIGEFEEEKTAQSYGWFEMAVQSLKDFKAVVETSPPVVEEPAQEDKPKDEKPSKPKQMRRKGS